MKEKIIFALDFPTYYEAEEYIHLLGDHVGMFKIGLQLFSADGKRVVERIREKTKADIFFDLKFYDIPSTVEKAVKAICEYKPKFLTIHTFGGSKMLKAAINGCSSETTLLAVTVITSMSESDLMEIGLKGYSTEWTSLMLGNLAKQQGFKGYVCSPLELKRMRSMVGDDAILVTPGIRLENSTKDDQSRIATPQQAVKDGADYLVIGRSIRLSNDPVKTVKQIIKSIEK